MHIAVSAIYVKASSFPNAQAFKCVFGEYYHERVYWMCNEYIHTTKLIHSVSNQIPRLPLSQAENMTAKGSSYISSFLQQEKTQVEHVSYSRQNKLMPKHFF